MKNTKRALVETDGAHKNSSSKVLKTAQSVSGVKAQAWDPLDCEPVIVTATAAEVEEVCAAVGLGKSNTKAGSQVHPKDGTAAMRWMISPVPVKKFVNRYLEKRPLLIQRTNCEDFYARVFGMDEVDSIVRTKGMQYTYNVDVTRVDDGNRATFNSNMDGTTDTVDADSVWKRYQEESCSVRLLHPQRYCDKLWPLMSALETFWTSAVGCNTYLTPPSSQGFAPHWDDIDAFILQCNEVPWRSSMEAVDSGSVHRDLRPAEGRKHWRVYKPRCLEEVLPRASSEDFTDSDIGEAIIDVELGPGDMLYMPRGFIHQANCVEGSHSLHLTISANQANTFADFMELALSAALQTTVEECYEVRRSLPPDYVSYMGVMHSDKEDDPRRTEFLQRASDLMAQVVGNIPWDDASDQMAVRYLQQRLPLCKAGPEGASKKSKGTKARKLNCSSHVRLVAKDVARLAVEGDKAVLYHIMDNSRGHHMQLAEESEDCAQQGVLEFEIDSAEVLEYLLNAFPKPIALEHWTEDMVCVAQIVLDKGIIEMA